MRPSSSRCAVTSDGCRGRGSSGSSAMNRPGAGTAPPTTGPAPPGSDAALAPTPEMRFRPDAGDGCGDGGFPRRSLERKIARDAENGRRQHRPRIPVGEVEREQQAEARRLVGESRDEIERGKRREEAKRCRDAEDHTNGHASGIGGHEGTIGLPQPAVKHVATHHTIRPMPMHRTDALAKSVPNGSRGNLLRLFRDTTRGPAGEIREFEERVGSVVRFQKQESQRWDGKANGLGMPVRGNGFGLDASLVAHVAATVGLGIAVE